MSLYVIAVFLHVVGALGLFAALGIEWASLYNLRRAATPEQAREWAKLLRSLRFVGGPAALTLLVTGIHLSLTRWGHQGWIGLSLLALIFIAVLTVTLSGRRARGIARALAPGGGSVAAALDARLRDPVLLVSAWLRTALALGVVFLMVVKPSGPDALTAMGVALVLGLGAGSSAWGRGRRTGALTGPGTPINY